MVAEDAADRAAFVDPGDFGIAASYTLAAGGPAVTVNGIFDNEFAEIDTPATIAIGSTDPEFTCATADLPAGHGEGDSIVIEGVTYTVRGVEPDGTGMTKMVLERA